MTKEMRPSHRVDILTHALLYYGMQKKQRLCTYTEQSGFVHIYSHYTRSAIDRAMAQTTENVAEESFRILANSYKGDCLTFAAFVVLNILL